MEKIIENLKSEELINALIILVVAFIVNKIIRTILRKTIEKSNKKHIATILMFSKKIITFTIYTIALLIALYQFETFSALSITLLSGIGLLVTVIGLAMKESLNNFLGSFELILSPPFVIGDYIKLPEKNIRGTVEEISLRHTVIRTLHNEREVIPNALLNTLIIENSDFKDNEVVLTGEYSISYTADVEKAIEIMKEEIQTLCNVKLKKDVEFPKVRVIKWADSSIVLRGYIWGNDVGEAYENLFEYNKILKIRFQKEGIEIPYNYLNVISKKDN